MQTEPRGHCVAGAFPDSELAARAGVQRERQGTDPGDLASLTLREGVLVDSRDGQGATDLARLLRLAPDRTWLVATYVDDPHPIRRGLDALGAEPARIHRDPVQRAAEESFPTSDPPGGTPGHG